MKRFFSSLCALALWACVAAPVSAQRNWLRNSATQSQVGTYLASIGRWRAEQKRSVLQALNQLPGDVKEQLIAGADKYNSFAWPNLPATVFLEYGENGNRTHYQDIRGERRRVLSELVIGELLERKGRFLPQIINGIWAIAEESTWAYPAHMSLQHQYSPLPRPGEDIVDLGAGSTAALMSWVYFLMHDTLATVSDIVPQRIRYELERRIIRPFLARDDFWWMGFHGQSVNNWNPFVNGKVLLTNLLTTPDGDVLARVTYRTMQSVDYFINQYPDDGGCDEGPSYWGMAGGAMIMYLELLDHATAGIVNITSHPLIADIGKYIYKLNIGDHEFVDFADAHPHMTPNIPGVFSYGKAFHSDTLKRFAAYYAKQGGDISRRLVASAGSLESFMDELTIYPELKNTTPALPLIKSAWLPDLEVLTERTEAGTVKGLFLAAKGGNNAESHNHNDIGNFLLYVNGKPAVVDIGVGTYTRETFSKDRYKIFTMQSAWHNLPTINGVMQHAGKTYKAKDVKLERKGKLTTLSMDLAGAYPAAAGVKTWQRILSFDGGKLTLRERYALSVRKDTTFLSLITPRKTRLEKGSIILGTSGEPDGLKISYDPRVFRVVLEAKPLTDPSLLHSWPEGLTRIKLIQLSTHLKGDYQVVFRPL